MNPILVIDADAARRAETESILSFLGHSSICLENGSDAVDGKYLSMKLGGIVLGHLPPSSATISFIQRLGKKTAPPPILSLVGEDISEEWHHHIHTELVTKVTLPLRANAVTAALAAPTPDSDEKRSRKRRHKAASTSSATPIKPVGPTGNSPATTRLREMIARVSPHGTTVLLLGQSGTGKEVTARAIHELSERAGKPFVAVNCGAIPSELLESELFGHEKGAFTGALTSRKGRFEMADGGTLLLDEIGDMSLPMQVKLLRVLQERSFQRVGGTETIHCDVRVICATHRNLAQSIKDGRFREDLYYRINVFPIEMPSLKDRIADLPAIIEDITSQMSAVGRPTAAIDECAISALQGYDWPGNIRELCNLLERLGVLWPGEEITVDMLPKEIVAGSGKAEQRSEPTDEQPRKSYVRSNPSSQASQRVLREARRTRGEGVPSPRSLIPPAGINLKDHIEQYERALILEALDRNQNVVAHAADLLGMGRTTLHEKMRRLGISRSEAIY